MSYGNLEILLKTENISNSSQPWNVSCQAVEVESDERIATTEEYVRKNVRRDILSIKRVSKVDAGVYYGFALNMGNADATGTGVQSDSATLRVIGQRPHDLTIFVAIALYPFHCYFI